MFYNPYGSNQFARDAMRELLGFELREPLSQMWTTGFRMVAITPAEYAEAEAAHQRWLKEWPELQIERAIQRRFDRCCHGKRA